MKSLTTILILLSALTQGAFCQKHDANWVFGDSILIQFSPDSSFATKRIDKQKYVHLVSRQFENASSYSTDDGRLVAYLDFKDQEGFNPGIIRDYAGTSVIEVPTFSSCAACGTFVPTSDSTFSFILNRYDSEVFSSFSGGGGGVYIVEFLLNSDNSITVDSVIDFHLETALRESIAIVRTGQDDGWYIAVHNVLSGKINILNYTSGNLSIVDSSTYIFGTEENSIASETKFSPDGKFFTTASMTGRKAYVCDFDRCAGKMSNCRIVFDENTTGVEKNSRAYGLEFSPSSEYLYLSATNGLYQIQLSRQNSIVHILEDDFELYLDSIGAHQNGIDFLFGQLELMPNGKIAVSHWSYTDGQCCTFNTVNQNLSVIEFPDSAGAACGWNPLSMKVAEGKRRFFWGLPSFPNYRIAPDERCPTSREDAVEDKGSMTIYPNPASDVIAFEYTLPAQIESAELEIYNLYGQLLETQSLRAHQGNRTIDVSDYTSGVYIAYLKHQGRSMLSHKFEVVH